MAGNSSSTAIFCFLYHVIWIDIFWPFLKFALFLIFWVHPLFVWIYILFPNFLLFVCYCSNFDSCLSCWNSEEQWICCWKEWVMLFSPIPCALLLLFRSSRSASIRGFILATFKPKCSTDLKRFIRWLAFSSKLGGCMVIQIEGNEAIF